MGFWDKDEHFVPLGKLLMFPSSAGYSQIQKTLYEADQKGFLVSDVQRGNYYVKGGEVARQLWEMAPDLVKELTPQTTLNQILQMVGHQEQVNVTVKTKHLSSEEEAYLKDLTREMQAEGDMVFELRYEGKLIGYYLNHERIQETQTGRVTYKCKGPIQHTNYSYDMETKSCLDCPFPVQQVIEGS